jgi:hypothetical protein
MNSLPKNIRNNLCKFSGEDFAIIRVCNKKIQLYFSIIGFFVLLILLSCFLSALSFTEHLFHNAFTDISVGIIWGYIVTNLYVLLLYTINPNILPKKEKRLKSSIKRYFDFNISLALRISLVAILAIITAQPLNILILKPYTQSFAFDIRNLLAQNQIAWVVTIFVVAIFLLPIYLKYSIRKLGEFYEKKAEIEKRIIEDDYQDFKKKYSSVMQSNISIYNKSVWNNLMKHLTKLEKINQIAYQKHFREITDELINEKIDKYEYWANPPYRTEQKSKIKNILSEQDLLNHIYPETN